jgi:hypothetical protein
MTTLAERIFEHSLNTWGFGITDTIEPHIPKIHKNFNKFTGSKGEFSNEDGFNPILDKRTWLNS